MRFWLISICLFLQCLLHPVASSAQVDDDVLIFAASSLKDALDQVIRDHPQSDNIRVSYASSGVLARQIEEGAPVDIFISANSDWMQYLVDRSLIASDKISTLAENTLVIATNNVQTKDESAKEILSSGQFSMGDPAHVPAGIYAKQGLENLGIWEQVNHNAIYGENARISLLTLARGEVTAVIGYQSDILLHDEFEIVFSFPASSHAPIVYPGVLVDQSSQSAQDVFNYLQSGDVQAIFQKAGFQNKPILNAQINSQRPDVNYKEIIVLSAQVAFVAMLIAVPLAFCVAYILARHDFFGKALLQAVVMLPLVMPPVVTGYFLLVLFGRQGVFGRYLSEYGITFGFEWTGAALAAAVMAFPLLVRPMRLAIELIDEGVDNAAKTLGAGFWVRLATITIPLAMPGIIAGTVLGFAKALGEFGATITFVSNIPGQTQTFSLAIYSLLQSPAGDRDALILVSISVGIAILAVFISEWIVSNMSRKGGRHA